MVNRSISIHAHFYQPPREDPFTGMIPEEVGPYPYKNWNERIHAECYRPNAELGNFEHISFNVGPTLLQWMSQYKPDTVRMIVSQDQANVQRYGVGNAMAQAYNHTILPLAAYQDKVTQITWGIADFEHHFGRKPQGMWLPETAVDLETLTVLAEQGIEYTILAPWQADTDSLDPTEPYRVKLPDDRSMLVFFYHRDLSGGISFNPALTSNADAFIQQEVAPLFNPEKLQRNEPQMIIIATDGELYGHHQHFRDRFLKHLINGASSSMGLSPSYPALLLHEFPTPRLIDIRPRTSWSCHHGVIRWMGLCDCTPGDGRWKAYLRQAFVRLAEQLDDLYQAVVWKAGIDPWALRNRYIHVVLGHMPVRSLILESAGRSLDDDLLEVIRLLLESQYERQRMFTSCGWYFEDFSRIEPKNNVAYAARAVWLARKATGVDLSPQVQADLKHVISHRTGLRGDMVFQWHIQRSAQTMEQKRMMN